jgi:hypothetical protein
LTNVLADARAHKNGRHLPPTGRSAEPIVFGRLASYEDVNDPDRLSAEPVIALSRTPSASQMGRFDTKWLIRLENLFALDDLARPADRKGAPAASAEARRA